MFESELQSIDPNVTLPFWDWTSIASIAQGMAPAHTDPTFIDNEIQSNPLASGPIEDRSRQTRRTPPHHPHRLRSYASSVLLAMDNSDSYLDFNNRLEGPHNSVHVWIGGPQGDMSTVSRAAYDPIFWSHHATVDRQWAIWQKCNPTRTLPMELLSQPLPGFADWTIADTLDLSSPRLDYTYEGLDEFSCPLPTRIGAEGSVLFNARVDTIHDRKPRIVVEIHDVDREGTSFMVDLFVRDPSTADREAFGGSFGIFGAEGLHSAHHGHHHSRKATQHIDITEAVDSLGLRGQPVEIRLNAINKSGDIVEATSLPIGALDLRIVP